ncbi:MAG: hypothetical protein EBS86_17590, partial [Crocinitomicaceae bacterium]|nr:hypothetical protein [Crocinitomicaceae bacterium]
TLPPDLSILEPEKEDDTLPSDSLNTLSLDSFISEPEKVDDTSIFGRVRRWVNQLNSKQFKVLTGDETVVGSIKDI